ncbi:hypothetical protein GQ53DRAFT_788943 [Thozetella sp. PMI_491]|nr:hypothetical protein GQ53DRAFT_788943 [Thozetella sp. PMI_491]
MARHHTEKSEEGEVFSFETKKEPRKLSLLLLVALVVAAAVLVLHGSIEALSRQTGGVIAQLVARPVGTDQASRLGLRGPLGLRGGEEKATVLQNIQIAQPVLMPYGAADTDGSSSAGSTNGQPPQGSCTATLMVHVFGNSYGKPYVGSYTPPNCQFNRVVMNFTVVSQGRQFDRLALMYFGDTEVWRTSTAEPTNPPGIRWVYLKDMTEYLYFWKSPQKVIFDLGNVIDDTYTGYLNTTLTATFFQSDVATNDAAPPSDLIIPISARLSANGSASVFMVPKVNATNTLSFPRNANRAVFSLSACGQANEEFWWSNVLDSDRFAFNSTAGEFPGFSPFREVQVLIDGQLAGVQWPFPVIFTGGVVPGLHRPVAGVDAFDLKEHQIDISPFIPMLADGAEHTFTIRVAGIVDNGGATGELTNAVDNDWYVTGKIFVWLDDEGSVTTGDKPMIQMAPPVITMSRSGTKAANGTNRTLDFDLEVSRTVLISALVRTQKKSETVSWSQKLSYSNKVYISDNGFSQVNNFVITGSDQVLGSTPYRSDYKYPLFANTTSAVSAQGNISLWAHVTQGKEFQVSGATVFPTGLEAFSGGVSAAKGKRFGAALLTTSKDGTASYFQSGDKKSSSSFGNASQVFHFGGVSNAGSLGDTPDVELYSRSVTAVNGSLTYDHEIAAVVPEDYGYQTDAVQIPLTGGQGPRAFLGRGSSQDE